jgi:hypothetical protein
MGFSLYDPVVGISHISDLVRVKNLILVIEQNSTSFAVITDATVATVSNSYNNTWTNEGIFMTNLILFSSTTLK